LTSKDQKFVREAAQGGLAEVELGKLAAEKASSDQVKKFGQRMADDHSKANDELKELASKNGIQLPTDLDSKDKALKDRLSKMSGSDFDKAYMQSMVKDHKKDVADFRKESTSGSNNDVKQFATQTLPTLEEHLKQAQSISPSAGTTGSGQ
jgi:putative membrane protein